jgi:hypothetical protein
MKNMRFKVGDRVRIKSLDWYNENKDNYGAVYAGNGFAFWNYMAGLCGEIMTISSIKVDSEDSNKGYYFMENSEEKWTDEMIEGLVEEENIIDIDEFQDDNEIIDIIDEYVHRLKDNECQINLPEGYQFKDENGNVINAQKIVLEKKKSLTQEQINAMVHDSCVSFCKHCGCGVPRETCTSLGTCKEHDEYRTAIRTCLMKKNKKK